VTESQRLILALVLVALYLVWVGYLFWRHKGRYLFTHISDSELLVAYASQTGTAQGVAEELANNHHIQARTLSAITIEKLAEYQRAIFVVSTYGHGEPPDNGRSFLRRLNQANASSTDLSHLDFNVIALGDSKYPHFCAFGEQIEKGLKALGAVASTALEKRDRSDSALTQDTSVQTDSEFEQFTLVNRRQLNNDSTRPLFEIDLRPTSDVFSWHPGDILDILPGINSGDQEQAAARSYTIASLPEEGIVKLIIRLVIKPDGELGKASGWVSRQLDIGCPVRGKLHRNPSCYLTEDAKPILLIGAGSGLAGIRSQWLHAAKQTSRRLYVIYGEREPDNDDVLPKVIEPSIQHAPTTAVNRVFSRCQKHPSYVQQSLSLQMASLQDVVDNGGQIYVCGSYAGMGEGIHHTLNTMLGEDTVNQLIDARRYHRDVY